MRWFIIKLLLKIVYNNYEVKAVDLKRMNEWLITLTSSENGFKDYYTVRKRHISENIATGLEQKEYWMMVGRLQELKYLAAISEDTLKKDKVNKKDL